MSEIIKAAEAIIEAEAELTPWQLGVIESSRRIAELLDKEKEPTEEEAKLLINSIW